MRIAFTIFIGSSSIRTTSAASIAASDPSAPMEIGKTELKGKDLLVNIAQTKPKTKEEAKLETHNEFIDIQIPLSGTEVMGYTAAKDCVPADAPYNVEKDITFFEGLAETYVAVKPGMFAIFFPQDGHAPGITPDGVKKVIVKVKA